MFKMLGQIVAIKSENRNGVLYCEFRFESIVSFKEYNDIIEAFKEKSFHEQGTYKMERKGQYLIIERLDNE